MTTEDAPCRVWWFEGFWEEDRFRAPVSAYRDRGGEPYQNIGWTAEIVRRREPRFTEEDSPECLLISGTEWGKRRDFDDFGPSASAGILVSGAMIDLLSNFDLGETQVLELPLFEGVDRPRAEFIGMDQPDLSRPVPGRWGLLHVLAKKDAVIEDQCRNIAHSVEAPWLDYQMLSVPIRGAKTEIALARDVACDGPDLWFDKRISTVPFISDRLRLAIEEAGLRVPTMKWLKEAKLYETKQKGRAA